MTEGIGKMLSGLLGQGGGTGNVLQSLLKVVNSQGGGLGELLSKLRGGDSPVANQFGSWVGTGENQPVTPDQAEQAVGSDTVAQVAQDAGVSHEEAKTQLAGALPQLVDKISPDGKLPDLGALSSSLGKLFGR